MNASIEIQNGIKNLTGQPEIKKYFNNSGTPYVSVAEVMSQIPLALRHQGLTVNVSGTEYWWPTTNLGIDPVVKVVLTDISGKVDRISLADFHVGSIADLVYTNYLEGSLVYTSVEKLIYTVMSSAFDAGVAPVSGLFYYHNAVNYVWNGTFLVPAGTVPDVSTKADLVNGVVPASQLPSFVDDILDVLFWTVGGTSPSLSDATALWWNGTNLYHIVTGAWVTTTPEKGKIYLNVDTASPLVNGTFRWSGSVMVQTNSVDLSAYLTATQIADGYVAKDGTKVLTDVNLTVEMAAEIAKVTNKADKMSLLSITTAPTANLANVGKFYFNSTSKMIAQCIDTAGSYSWNESYGNPSNGTLYLYDGKNYQWDGTNLSLIPSSAVDVPYANATYTTVGAALDKLLYVAPQITSFTGGSTNEIGSTVDPTLNWAYNKTITEQKINNVVETLANRTKSYTNIVSNTTYTLWATDGTNTATTTQSVLFKYYRFWGVGTTPSGADNAARRTAIIAKNPGFIDIQAGSFTMQTGTVETNFFICVPPGLSVTNVYDSTANAVVALNAPVDYVINDAGGTARTYKMYTVSFGAPFSSTHNWSITVA